MTGLRAVSGARSAGEGVWDHDSGTAAFELPLRAARWTRVEVEGSADPPAAVTFALEGRGATELGVLGRTPGRLAANVDARGARRAELRVHGDPGRVALRVRVRSVPALAALARAFLVAARHHRARGGDLPRLVLRSLRGLAHAPWRTVELVQRDIVAAPAVYGLWWERTRRRSDAAAARVTDVRAAPTISLLMPLYNTPEPWLRRCLDTVLAQRYPRWELCVGQDASTAPHVRPMLDALAAREPRVRVTHRERNGNIVAATNTALALASGEYVGLLDSDDELTPDALLETALAIDRSPDVDLVYSDEDKIDDAGRHFEPYFKPDWSPELLLTHMYTAHLSVYRRSLAREVGAFRAGTDGSQDYDLALRATERAARIEHVPKVLYHWRVIPGSTAARMDAKPFRHRAAVDALEQRVARGGDRGRVEALIDPPSYFRVHYEPRARSVDAIVFGPHAERTARFVRGSGLPVRTHTLRERDARAIAAVVAASTAPVVLLLDSSLAPPTGAWLARMAGYAEREGIGAVGCRIVSREGLVEESGLLVNGGRIVPAHAGYPATSNGYLGRLLGSSDCSAVTGCVVVSRRTLDAVGGIDPADGDRWELGLSLRALAAGLRNVCLADLVASRTRPRERAGDVAARRAIDELVAGRPAVDPYYSPNLDPSGDFSLAWPA